jgi:hypothetical protein
MKYYVKKEWSPIFNKPVYRAYRNSNYTDYVYSTGEDTLEELHKVMQNIDNPQLTEELGEFDTATQPTKQ